MKPVSTLPRVIVVDDEEIVCQRLQPPLERLGLEVETFTDSKAAAKRLGCRRFDVLITDLKMAKPDGLELLRMVRSSSPDTHVIVISAYATVDAAREVMKGGAVDFIPKPFKISQIRALIQDVLGLSDS